MITLMKFSSNRSSLSTVRVKTKMRQSVRSSLQPLIMLLATGLLVSADPVRAETVPLSTLIANSSAEITGPGGLAFSHFTFSQNSSLVENDISVTTDSVSSTQSRIRLGLFTVPAGGNRSGTITYQVSTASPITDFHLVTPAAVIRGQPGRNFENAGYVLNTDVTGVGTTFISRVGLGVGLGPADSTLHRFSSNPPTVEPPTFPSNAARLTVVNSLQMSGGSGNPNESLTLPHFDNVYTITVVPEPSTWLLLTSGVIALLRRRANSSPKGGTTILRDLPLRCV